MKRACPMLVHWCHGAPGAVALFCLASKIFDDDSYFKIAVRACETIWEYGLLKKGAGLCHGTSGNGYCLLTLYQHFPEGSADATKWLTRAYAFGDFILTQYYPGKFGDRPYSLFEGWGGALCYLQDLIHCPRAASFPFYELQDFELGQIRLGMSTGALEKQVAPPGWALAGRFDDSDSEASAQQDAEMGSEQNAEADGGKNSWEGASYEP